MVHEEKKHSRCNLLDYSFSQKGDIKTHVSMDHEEKKPLNMTFVTTNFLGNKSWNHMSKLFMKEKKDIQMWHVWLQLLNEGYQVALVC